MCDSNTEQLTIVEELKSLKLQLLLWMLQTLSMFFFFFFTSSSCDSSDQSLTSAPPPPAKVGHKSVLSIVLQPLEFIKTHWLLKLYETFSFCTGEMAFLVIVHRKILIAVHITFLYSLQIYVHLKQYIQLCCKKAADSHT